MRQIRQGTNCRRQEQGYKVNDRVVVTRHNNAILSFLIKEDRVFDILGYRADEKNDIRTGDIFKAKVINIQKNINAAFLFLIPGVKAFMDIPEKEDIRPEQELIVQVVKDSYGEKEIAVTPNYSLSGRYLAISSGRKGVGVSKKLPEERRRELREKYLSKMETTKDLGLVIRTNAGNASDTEIEDEFDALYGKIRDLKRRAEYSVPYIRLYSELRPESGFIRDLRELPEKIVTDDPEIYEALREDFRKDEELYGRISLYKDDMLPLKKLYRLEAAIDEAQKRTVYLKSSGTLIIDRTEACHVMDVNSGKNTDKLSKKELVLHTNLEAVTEAARQMRIRNLSGMILIDLINMTDIKDRKKVIETLRDELKKDRLKAEFIDITGLGIAEITREKKMMSLCDILRNCN